VSAWQPIETAPLIEDAMESPAQCLVYSNEFGIQMGRACRYSTGEHFAQAYGFNGAWNITHWMPLPEPPP